MVRVVLLNLLLFLVPFAIYGGLVWLSRPKGQKEGIWRDAPIVGLVGAGIALVVSVLVFFVAFGGAGKEGTYRPAEYRDGELVPGRVERE